MPGAWTNADKGGREPLPLFDGEGVTRADARRLSRELDYVRSLMGDGEWWTLAGLALACFARYGATCSEAGISARIRDLRKPRHGSRTVEKRRKHGTEGTWEYRLLPGVNSGT